MVDRMHEAKRWLAIMLVAGALGATPDVAPANAISDAVRQGVAARYDRLPMLFEEFDGRTAERRSYVARGAGYHVAIFAGGALLALRATSAPGERSPDQGEATVVGFAFLDANASAWVRGLDPQPTRIHHLRGRADGPDRTDVATYSRVEIGDLFPGIDAVFYGNGQRLEYDLIVAPGADPSRVRLKIEGITGMGLAENGDLQLDTRHGTMTLHRPLAYQEHDGEREHVDSAYAIGDGNVVTIRVGVYDESRPLVIDPVVSYATYLGGSLSERGTAIAVDADGNAYVTGFTTSSDFPVVSAYDRSLGKRGDTDVFVAKLNPAGTGLVYATYLGGSTGIDRATGIAVDAAGSAYVTGMTSAGDFPVSANAYQPSTSGGGAFITKLVPAGNALVYSTYLWGTAVAAIAVDASGNALVTGNATSLFATTANAIQPTLPPPLANAGFVLKLDPTGTAARYATFLPGSAANQANAIAVDLQGNAYVAGWTTATDFPVISGYQPALRGQKDGFVAKIDPAGSRFVYSTFLGGSLDDIINAIAVDADGNAHVAGETYSSDFPSLNAFQPKKSGFRLVNSSLGNAFVTKLDATGSTLRYSSFLGGEICTSYCQSLGGLPQYPGDAAYGIAVDRDGHAFVTGLANTYTFPLVDSSAPRKQQDNQDSAFVAKVSASGASLLFSTFVRTGYAYTDDRLTRFPPDAATGVATDQHGAAYVTGFTDGTGQFVTTPGAFQTGNGGGQGAYVVKFAGPPATLVLETSNPEIASPANATLTVTVAGLPMSGNATLLSGTSFVASAPIVDNRAAFDIRLPVGIHSLSALLAVPGSHMDSASLQQIVDNPLACVR
ncbi:MAG TPA: SBBP repeat-containing protein [Casimicrobiaceae bacterium]|nr:SBBP repeat-containing protein [Casimicrobiaceae bacterium]